MTTIEKPNAISQWNHDVFPVLKKTLAIGFLVQFIFAISLALFTGHTETLFSFHLVFPASLLLLAVILYIPFFNRVMGRYYPIAFISLLLFIPAFMMYSRLLDAPAKFQGNLFIDYYNQVPMIFTAMVFTAWFYKHKGVIIFAVVMTLIDLPVLLFKLTPFTDTHTIWYLLGFRMLVILFIGSVISGMVKHAQSQGEKLVQSNAHLLNYHDTLEQLAANRERTSMARELHDTLAHSLTALTMQLEVTKALIEKDPTQAKTSVQIALDTAREGLRETRFALHNLRSRKIEQIGLLNGIYKLTSEIESPTLVVTLTLPEEALINRLNDDLQNTIYRITQEAIHNVKKHANATKLSIQLECSHHHIYLEIRDNGKGFDLTNPKNGGFGIKGMQERVALADGEIHFVTSPTRGTKVFASFDIQ